MCSTRRLSVRLLLRRLVHSLCARVDVESPLFRNLEMCMVSAQRIAELGVSLPELKQLGGIRTHGNTSSSFLDGLEIYCEREVNSLRSL